MLINEKHLSLIEPDTRKYLSEQMWRYFANEATDTPRVINLQPRVDAGSHIALILGLLRHTSALENPLAR